VALVGADVSEEPGAFFIRVTKIGELGTTQAATSNRRRFLQEPYGVTIQKTPFFIVTAVKTSNLTLVLSSLLEVLKMDKVLKPSVSECYTPPSELIIFYSSFFIFKYRS
jgi:hypothetical protein